MVSPYKERFIAQAGKEVPLDYFLYSCFEAETMIANLQKKAGGKENVDFRHPSLPDLAGKLSGKPDTDNAWQDAIASLYQWHCEREPGLLEKTVVDYEKVSGVVFGFSCFHADLRELHRLAGSSELPVFSESADLAPFWRMTMVVLEEKSPKARELFAKFFAWTYSSWEPPVYEVGSRPPIGRFAPPPRLRAGSGPGGGFGGGPGGRKRGGPERTGHHDRPDRPQRGEQSDRPERPARGGRDFDRPQREESRRGGQESEGRREGRRGPRRDDGHQDRAAAEAMSAVEDAIARLEREPSTPFVDLPPTNSFQRRKQHHTVNERGFQSESVGEGNNRAVRVIRGGGA
ncbi:MAG: hypothetical protein RIQ81_1708 [Pseudomonadota bacterium]|jgi:hypothetical protein